MEQTQEKRDVMKLLEAIGVDNADEVMASPENLAAFGKSMNQALGVGKRAVNQLQGMSERDPKKELESIGLKLENFNKHYDSLAIFQKQQPAFITCASTAKQSLIQYDGSSVEVEPGDVICMTASQYITQVQSRPTIQLCEDTFEKLYKPYKGEDLKGKTLFLWRSGGIGDLLFIRPILMAFKEKYEDLKIIFATREKYHSMVEQWDDCIDTLSTVPFKVDETLTDADYHITFEGLIERCKEAESLDVHDLFARHAYIKVTDYNRRMKCVCKSSVFELLPSDYVVMQLGASSPIRSPLYKPMVDAANYITSRGMKLIVSGSPRELREIDDFISCCESDEIINFARYTGSIVDAVKLVSGSQLVIAPDSSHVHMAAAQGIPCVGIYGPFNWKTRATHYKNFKAVEPDESDACEYGGRHCFVHSHLPCHYQTKCWKHLDSNKIIKAIEELMKWH